MNTRGSGPSTLTSPNCAAYTDTISVLAHGTATVAGREAQCTVDLPFTYSCQKKRFEAPDEATATQMRAAGRAELERRGCNHAAATYTMRTNQIGTEEKEFSAEKLGKAGMASNCLFAGSDVNNATHQMAAVCQNNFDFHVDGVAVRDYNKNFHAKLMTCDASQEAMPQLMEDVRKVAAWNATQNGFVIGKDEHLACQFSMLPVL